MRFSCSGGLTNRTLTNLSKECAILALGISNFWMESQLFVLYTGGEGLVYRPLNQITVALGFLPVLAVTIFTVRCYITVRYRRVWDVTSYYKDQMSHCLEVAKLFSDA